ncbi:MAG TPA: GNAT family N-acetyltransferase [Candidatus Elarobacter sp.]|jgi:RimJ/RimL family protein N-acetyltransferase|nr:GNAT family N-acetyltransferase [Candidatus Elarobacter sp.]
MARLAWTIRPAGERDAVVLVELLGEVAREGRFIATEWPFDVEARAQALRDAILERRVVGWVAVEGRTIVGDLRLSEIASAEPELGMLVRASHRGRGIGAALIAAAQAWARANGKRALSLRVFPDNEPALALYRAHGFADVELQRRAVPRRDGSAWDALLMRCEIAER